MGSIQSKKEDSRHYRWHEPLQWKTAQEPSNWLSWCLSICMFDKADNSYFSGAIWMADSENTISIHNNRSETENV